MRTVAAIGLLLATRAFAEIAVGESIEWLTATRPHIAIVSVTGPPTQVRVTRVLKGEPPPEPHLVAVLPGHDQLVFFDANKNVDVRYDLTNPPTNFSAALGMNMSVLDSREKIIGAVEARLKRRDPTPAALGYVQLEVPPSSSAYRALYSGSACFLVVPPDPEVKARLVEIIGTSKSAHDRASAVKKLVVFPGPDTVTLLRGLLEDPAVEMIERSDGKVSQKVEVPVVRQAAWDALKKMGVEAPKPKGL